nr:MAG TPA: hypothetical protein [Bacteriophage sp.]
MDVVHLLVEVSLLVILIQTELFEVQVKVSFQDVSLVFSVTNV